MNKEEVINQLTHDVKTKCIERLKKGKVLTSDKPVIETYGVTSSMKKKYGL